MTTFFDRIYRYIGHRHPAWRDHMFVKLLRVVTRQLANLLLPIQYRLTASRSSSRLDPKAAEKTSGRLIVSLTSFPARTPKLWLVVESLLRQTHKPDMIILWLSKVQYPGGLSDLPASLTRLTGRGLKIEFREGDIRSHKKYYYMQKEYPNDYMVTVDDDIFYDSHLLEHLWAAHLQHPSAIVCNYSHQLTFDAEGHLRPYNHWNFHSEAADHLFFIGVGGNLFPPGSLSADVTDLEAAYATCPAGDDIWLNAMARHAGTPIIHSSLRGFTGLPVLNKSNVSLCTDNVVAGSGNDQQIAKLDAYFLDKYGHLPFRKG